MKDRFYLPEKYRNTLFTFSAGGYDGCIWHVAAVVVTRDGDVALVWSDGGAGGLDEQGWYSRKMRERLDELHVATSTDLYHRNPAAYRELEDFRLALSDERRDRERVRVYQALESELGGEVHGWDHEFRRHSLATPDDVRAACRAVAGECSDVFFQAAVAQALADDGYDGAGFVCSQCGRLCEATELGPFAECVDRDSCRGCGGLAVTYDRILCDDCRNDETCPVCGGLGVPSDLNGLSPRKEFMHAWVTACETCVDRFLREHKDYAEEIDEICKERDDAKRTLERYLDAMRAQGASTARLDELRHTNEAQLWEDWRHNVNELRDAMEAEVERKLENAYGTEDRI